MAPLLEARALEAHYGWTQVLHVVGFAVEEGGITTSAASTILGPYQNTVAAMSRQTTKKTLASRQPPSHQPSAVNPATNPPRRSQAFKIFRAAAST